MNEIAVATTVGSLADPVGTVLGMVLGPFYVEDADMNDREKGLEDVNQLLFVNAIIVTALCIPILLIFRERPKHFPSQAAKNQSKTKFDFKKDLGQLARNSNYFFITICFSCLYGVYCCFGAIVNELL